ncbi:hypothetical protein BC828DRAFT_287759 [Blastocladiella britannica]|nr:hypothetical protein BC828DRAFT_287759 [Blastocladiella britannica]
MGNHISQPVLAPPLETLVSALPDFSLDRKLGSARFLKSVRGRSSSTGDLLVVKVFVKPDPDLDLRHELRATRDSAVNALRLESNHGIQGYLSVVETERAVFLTRPYFQHNLYDRISTRPFLCHAEREWIAFQLIHAVARLHQRGIRHGDLKSENVMLTSSLHVVLVDPAPFKPVALPADNPSEYLYFYDAQGRRACHVAPERFVRDPTASSSSSTSNPSTASTVAATSSPPDQLTDAMDVYALGCVLAELFLDDDAAVVLDLSKALAYGAGDVSVMRDTLAAIEDVPMRTAIEAMVALDPSARPSAASLCNPALGLFPTSFFTHMAPLARGYLACGTNAWPAAASSIPPPPPAPGMAGSWTLSDLRIQFIARSHTADPSPPELAVLIVQLVTSSLRSVSLPSALVVAINSLATLAANMSDTQRLDRAVPFVVWVLQHVHEASARRAAISALASMVTPVQEIIVEDIRLFHDMLLPLFEQIVFHEPSVLVRAEFASRISEFADACNRFWVLGKELLEKDSEYQESSFAYLSTDVFLADMQLAFRRFLQRLLSDPEVPVRRAVLKGMPGLCRFIGAQFTSDEVLGHLVSLLDVKDEELSGDVFQALVSVGQIAGEKALRNYLYPLVLQPTDGCSGTLTYRIVQARRSLIETGAISQVQVHDLIAATAPYLTHPNGHLRYAAAECIGAALAKMTAVSARAFAWPVLRKFVADPRQTGALKGTKELVGALRSKDQSPAHRAARRHPLAMPPIDLPTLGQPLCTVFLDTDALPTPPPPTSATATSSSTAPIASAHGPPTHPKLIVAALHAANVAAARSPVVQSSTHSRHQQPPPGALSSPSSSVAEGNGGGGRGHRSTSPVSSVRTATAAAEPGMHLAAPAETGTVHAVVTASMSRSRAAASSYVHLDTASTLIEEQGQDESQGGGAAGAAAAGPGPTAAAPHSPFRGADDAIAPKASYTQGLIASKQSEMAGLLSMTSASATAARVASVPAKWMPIGDMLATLTEHTAAVNQLALSFDSQMLLSVSADGTLKAWDPVRVMKNLGTRSRVTHVVGGDVVAVATVPPHLTNGQPANGTTTAGGHGHATAIHTHAVVVGNDAGKLQLVAVHMRGRSAKAVAEHQLPADEGVVAMCVLGNGGASVPIGSLAAVVLVATSQSCVRAITLAGGSSGTSSNAGGGGGAGLPSRTMYELHTPPAYGSITTLLADPIHQAWALVGTTRGILVLFDLRFRTRVAAWTHYSRTRIHAIAAHPSLPDHVLISTGRGQVSVWDVARQAVSQVFSQEGMPVIEPVATHDPSDFIHHIGRVFTEKLVTEGILALCPLVPGGTPGVYFTGTDRRLRHWSLENGVASIIGRPVADHPGGEAPFSLRTLSPFLFNDH